MMKVRRNYTQDILISAQHLPAGDEGCGHKVVRGVVSSRHIIGVKNSLMCQTCLTLTLWASATTRWEEWQFSKSTLTLWASAATRWREWQFNKPTCSGCYGASCKTPVITSPYCTQVIWTLAGPQLTCVCGWVVEWGWPSFTTVYIFIQPAYKLLFYFFLPFFILKNKNESWTLFKVVP